MSQFEMCRQLGFPNFRWLRRVVPYMLRLQEDTVATSDDRATMRYLILLGCLFLTACEKSTGQICIDNYMQMYEQANPDADNEAKAARKRGATIQCTVPRVEVHTSN